MEEKKISNLEKLIPQLELIYEYTPRHEIDERARMRLKIEEYKLEYFERTGRRYYEKD